MVKTEFKREITDEQPILNQSQFFSYVIHREIVCPFFDLIFKFQMASPPRLRVAAELSALISVIRFLMLKFT